MDIVTFLLLVVFLAVITILGLCFYKRKSSRGINRTWDERFK